MSYVGNSIEIPLGPGGLTGSKNLAGIPAAFFLEATNISYETGSITKEGGSTKYNTNAIPAAPRIIGGWDWWPLTTAQRMVVIGSNGSIYKDSGLATFPVSLKVGMTVANVVPVFVEGGKEVASNSRKLFIFTGANPVQVLAGDANTTTGLATPPADWGSVNQPIGGCVHEGRLWGYGNLNDPHRMYYSTTANHEDLTGAGAGTVAVYPGEGEQILAAMSYKGALIVWKRPYGVYMVDTSSPTVSNWRVSRLSQSVGISSPRGFVAIDNDVLYQDKDGNFQLLSATADFGDLQSRNLSKLVLFDEYLRDKINLSRLPFAKAVYYSAKREAHFVMAGSGFTVNNRRVVIDFNGEQPRFRVSTKDVSESLWLRKDSNLIPRLVSGDDAGFVWHLDQLTKAKAGAGYISKFQTAHNDLSEADPALVGKQKLLDFLELSFQTKGDWNFFVDVVCDGRVTQTVPYSMAGPSAKFGTAKFGSSQFGSTTMENLRKRLVGTARRISLIGRNASAGEDFSISKAVLYFRPGDERTGR